MNGFEKTKFVPISIDDLVGRCSQFADQFIEGGDILPPKDWFEEGGRSEILISGFDMDLMSRITVFILRLWKLISGEEPWSPTLPNAFALRCIALFAERHLRLAFLNKYDTTTIKLSAVDKDRAFYWALTSFWRYSKLADRIVVVKEELQRLRYKHDISLLNDKWQRGKTGNYLLLEQDKRKEREARQALQACIAKVEETQALISNRKMKR